MVGVSGASGSARTTYDTRSSLRRTMTSCRRTVPALERVDCWGVRGTLRAIEIWRDEAGFGLFDQQTGDLLDRVWVVPVLFVMVCHGFTIAVRSASETE